MTETMKMDPELKARWIEALRSGEFEQGYSLLKYSSGNAGESPKYCCLGVLSELCLIPLEGYTWDGEAMFIFPGNEGRASIEMPPREWLRSKGISNDVSKIIANMNDGAGTYDGERLTFAEIADYIQDNL